tara:strand:- start:37 stop:528 length:492 start_codon:yes stop_codon:yes gene_type:complete
MTTTITGALGIDNIQAATGSVLQVVSATTITEVSSTSNSTWVDTTLTATITPLRASSKILVLINQQFGNYSIGLGGDYKVMRNTTDVKHFTNYTKAESADHAPNIAIASFSIFDSPSSIEELVYKTQMKHRGGNSGTIRAQDSGGATVGALPESQITLMEVAG